MLKSSRCLQTLIRVHSAARSELYFMMLKNFTLYEKIYLYSVFEFWTSFLQLKSSRDSAKRQQIVPSVLHKMSMKGDEIFRESE